MEYYRDPNNNNNPPQRASNFSSRDMEAEHGSNSCINNSPIAIILISVEVAAAALLLYGLCYLVLRFIKGSRSSFTQASACDYHGKEDGQQLADKASKKGLFTTIVVPHECSPPSTAIEVRSQAKPLKKFPKAKLKQFTIAEVMHISDNLRIKLGHGGVGAVYHGRLASGQDVAIKRLSSTSTQSATQFKNELELMSRVCHENLVYMIGHCCELNERIIVCEYMPRGALHDHLYGREAGHEPLSWQQRLQIAIDTAKGLNYLHTGSKSPIIHRDVKSSNILLDHMFRAKVADFGLSKIMREDLDVSNGVKGTVGYLDPEYFASQKADEKSDVYGFGIVLLELICGRQALVPTLEDPSIVENIVDWVRPHLKGDTIFKIIDKRLDKKFNQVAMEKVLNIALMSVERNSPSRPTMTEILETLDQALKIECEESSKDEMFSKKNKKPISFYPITSINFKQVFSI